MVLGKYLLLDTSRNIDNKEYTLLFQFLQINKDLILHAFHLVTCCRVDFSILKHTPGHLLNIKRSVILGYSGT